MFPKTNLTYFCTFLIGCFVSLASVTEVSAKLLPNSVQETHLNLIKQLSNDQIKVLSSRYPDFRLLKTCSGNFSGGEKKELMLGLWHAKESIKKELDEDDWTQDAQIVGLLWNGSQWISHDIDGEMDEEKEHYPNRWEYSMDSKGFHGDMNCGTELEYRKDSQLAFHYSDEPFFDLAQSRIQNHTIACFGTHDVYNNWDCVVYSPNEGRFKLWYQQAFAD